MMLDVEADSFPAIHRDLARQSVSLMKFAVLFRYLSKGFSEDRDIVFDASLYLDFVPEGHFPSLDGIWGLQGYRLVAILLRDFDAAIPVLVLDIASPEDY
jgi:hypothetical protein